MKKKLTQRDKLNKQNAKAVQQPSIGLCYVEAAKQWMTFAEARAFEQRAQTPQSNAREAELVDWLSEWYDDQKAFPVATVSESYEGLTADAERAGYKIEDFNLQIVQAAWRLFRSKYPGVYKNPSNPLKNLPSFAPPDPIMNEEGPVSVSIHEENVMKVKRDAAVALFEALDYQNASKWRDDKLVTKLQSLSNMVDDETEVPDEESAKLLKKIVKGVAAGEEIELVGEAADDASSSESKSDKPAKKSAKKADKKGAKKSARDEDDDDDERVPIKKKKAAPKAGKKGPGVIQTIIAELRKGSDKKPVTKEKILSVLVKAFPEREEKAMKSTISSQIPSGLKTEKGLTVKSNDNGYWLPPEK